MIGRTISHYEIVSQIGAGGMGTVYRAKDTLLGRAVAIKVLPAEAMKDESRQRRFLQEARAASALNHPNIITIYDVLHVDGVHAIVMELLEGASLQARLAEGPLPPKQAVRAARQIADALAAAHAAGIVHRDLKPANVMLTERGIAKVLDFGIAKLDPMRATDQDATHTGALTMMGAVVGTAAYMSPEQARGEAVDGRSDIFSLGIVMYEMLTGKSPFAASTITGVLHKLIYEDPPELASYALDLPAGLGATVQRALAKQPGERFQTMESVGAVLDDIDVGRSTAELRAPIIRDRRAPSRAALGLAAAVLLSGGVAVWAWQAGWFGEPRPAVTDANLAADLPATADEAYRLGLRLLERYDKDGYVDRSIETFRRALDLRADYAAAHAGLGLAYWRKYREVRDRMWLDYAYTNASRAVELAPQLTTGLVAAAYARIERGELDEAQKAIDEALVLEPKSADGLAARAHLRLQQRRAPDALASVREARAIREDDWSLPLMEGVILLSTGAPAAAVPPLERAALLAPDSALVLRNLGAAYHAVDRPEDATRAFQNALEIKQDPAVYNNLGTVFFYRGLYDQAMRAFESATRLRGNDFRLWNSLADTYRLIPGRTADAAQAYTRALQQVDEGLAKTPENLELRTRRILMLAKRGDCADARSAAAEAELTKASPTEEFRVAAAWEVCKDRDRALEVLMRAIGRGYPLEQVRRDPDLTQLRDDQRFHKFLAGRASPDASPGRR
jgi:tetratricopeptide (TPR) repeat protein